MIFSLARRLFLAIVISLIMLSPAFAQTNSLPSLVTGNATFALDLYSRLKDGHDNLFFSPFSISYVPFRRPARAAPTRCPGPSLRRYSGSTPVLFGALQKLLNEAQRRGDQLNIANGLWGQSGHPFHSRLSSMPPAVNMMRN